MKNKLITIFAVIGAVAAIAGGVAYLLKVKKELAGIVENDQEVQYEEDFFNLTDDNLAYDYGM